jgi:SP family sugar:H+ symporter-like MFS transporter
LLNLAVRTIEDQSASWRIIIGLGMFFSLFLGVGVLFLPESPRWLASKHDWDGVRLSMARLRGKKDDPQHPLVEDDLQEMYALLEKEQKAGVKGWLACFSDLKSGVSRTTYRTVLGFAIHFFQQWTGINYFSEFIRPLEHCDGGTNHAVYYGASLFTGATSIGDELVVQIIIGVVNVVCTCE